MIEEKIKDQIRKALKALEKDYGQTFHEVEVELEHPAEESHGDYSSNIALQIYGRSETKIKPQRDLKKAIFRGGNPKKLAKDVVAKIEEQNPKDENIKKLKVAGPGFINFWLSEDFLLRELKRVLHLKELYGKSGELKGKKIMVEYTDPNPFKEFHIGHLYTNIVGESLARLFEAQGASVKRANYQGDVGMHVAKALYGLLRVKNLKSAVSKLEKKGTPAEKAKFLGKAYAVGATAFKEDKKAKKNIEVLNKKVYELDSEIKDLYLKGRQWSLDYFETLYKRLGTKFDFYYFEREAGEIGLRIVKENLKKGVFEKSKGAVIFNGEKYGLHKRVFINSSGLPTYEAKDLGLAKTKYKDFAYDTSIIVTGNEIDEYFRVVLAALKEIEPELASKTIHLGHGMVKLPEGKMSSRTGKVVTGEWLIDEVVKRARDVAMDKGVGRMGRDRTKVKDTHIVGGSKKRSEITEQVGVGAIKYAFLKSSVGRDIAFSFDESVNLDGNSGPYLQYTYARTKSVLKKASKRKVYVEKTFDIAIDNMSVGNREERALVRWLYKYPETVLKAGKEYSLSLICQYLFELAQRYNAFYNKHRILPGKNQKLRSKVKNLDRDVINYRLGLTLAVGQVLDNGLYLLGIKAPLKM